MSAPTTLPAESPTAAPASGDLIHYHCCDHTVALCGYVVSDVEWLPWADEPEPDDCPACVVAHQLSPTGCARCAA